MPMPGAGFLGPPFQGLGASASDLATPHTHPPPTTSPPLRRMTFRLLCTTCPAPLPVVSNVPPLFCDVFLSSFLCPGPPMIILVHVPHFIHFAPSHPTPFHSLSLSTAVRFRWGFTLFSSAAESPRSDRSSIPPALPACVLFRLPEPDAGLPLAVHPKSTKCIRPSPSRTPPPATPALTRVQRNCLGLVKWAYGMGGRSKS